MHIKLFFFVFVFISTALYNSTCFSQGKVDSVSNDELLKELETLNKNITPILNGSYESKIIAEAVNKMEKRLDIAIKNQLETEKKYLILAQWTVIGVAGIISVLIAGVGLYGFFFSKKSVDELTKKYEFLRDQFEKFKQDVVSFGSEAEKEMKLKLQQEINLLHYDNARKILKRIDFKKKRINIEGESKILCEIALAHLMQLFYNQYRLIVVTRHIGICYKALGRIDESLTYFNMSKEFAKEKNKENIACSMELEMEKLRE